MRPIAIALPPVAVAVAVVLALALVLAARPAHADTFSGFSGVDRPYLVNQDRVCQPLAVTSNAATGAPHCEKTGADIIARLSIKPPIVQSGSKASFTAAAAGRTITISRKAGGAIVTWDAPDPVVRLVDVYASQYDDRVAVAYIVRRLGKEVTDVVAFDLGQNQSAVRDATPPATGAGSGSDAKPGGGAGSSVITTVTPGAPPDPSVAGATGAAAPPALPADPQLAKAVADARAAAKPKALAAWKAVLALDGTYPEALFRVAAAEVAAKHSADALAAVQALAASQHPDAVEWQVEARFDPAFAAVRADPKFRAAVGLDRKPTTPYERLMGFGGQWEQTGTSCDKPEVHFVATRDRKFRLRVKTTCEGAVYNTPFQGTWRLEGQRVVLQLPNRGRAATVADEAGCVFEVVGDEDALRCSLGHDIEFVVLPTRR